MKISTILGLAGAACAQQSAYGQCGGSGYTGSTECVSGFSCAYVNGWYSQCQPGAAATTAPVTANTSITTSAKPVPTSSRQLNGTTTSKTLPIATSSSFSKTDGLQFSIDGVTSYFAGTNSYWMAFQMNNDDIDLALDHIKDSGLKILRVWGFNDVTTTPDSNTVWFQSFVSGQDPVINTGANGLQRLDYVVKAAESRGIKLIINFVNNWTDYGGMAAYMTYYLGSASSETNAAWYNSTDIQTQYKTYIKTVVSRYANSTAVFAWELANEPRCKGCETSVIYDWATSISAYIKSLDPNHMVTLGDEGFGLSGGTSYPYTYGEGVDFVKNLDIETIDFGALHLYPSSWGVTNDFGNEWITAHGAACATAGKPCLFEEYGVTSDHCNVEKPWQETALSTEGIAGDLFWDFGDTLSGGKTSDDGNTIFYDTDDWTCLVTDHVSQIG
ncbi:glycoside hydrolase family 5 protein [Aplosporella prunicola CBS 121167]|uniref:mannan endo-1,4-beta-mannosidase n=1 Tax=Aplosporella prunicola CBS 121167 TaxID=1176127 RepID=A0A6A6BJ02_9PEZI|nr:glycoside hydrolase family 5 protein [Aplosporella prunicola CBS 121167]KAF2143275.1 glycoside hydrolase family 5 protein [Aplosporella prunicola CBS 121167]